MDEILDIVQLLQKELSQVIEAQKQMLNYMICQQSEIIHIENRLGELLRNAEKGLLDCCVTEERDVL